jgi:DNA repair exonuclease SbcCD nuclease subunit
MYKKIIQVSDIHIPNYKRIEEYQEKLSEFIEKAKKIVEDNGKDNVCIVLCGDIVNMHNEVSNEAYVIATWFLKQLDKVCHTVVFAGNHDKTGNLERTDTLSAMFLNSDFKQTIYLDKELSYESGVFVDDNIAWCLFSDFDDFARPDIEGYRIQYPDKTFVALFHGDMVSAKTDTGYVTTTGESPSHFEGCDFGLFGHIHKRQCIKTDGIPLVYAGSLIQKDFGENVSGHGYVVWDVEKREFEYNDINNDENALYVVSIKDLEDLDNDTEEFINL